MHGTLLYLYEYFDITDNTIVHQWDITQPTTSPNGAAHAIDPNSFSIIDTYDPDDNFEITGNLIVYKQSFLKDRLVVSAGKATELGGTLTVAQTATFSDKLIVKDGCATELGGTLAVNGMSNFTGGVTMSGVQVTGTAQSGKVITNFVEAVSSGNDTITVTAKTIKLNADVQITGSMDTVSSTTIMIRDKVIQLGAIDADGNNVSDMNDTTRDGAGIVVPGTPQNLPSDCPPSLFEHSLRWNLNSGDFASGGVATNVMLKPLWEFMGGSVGIGFCDTFKRKARLFFAPTLENSTVGLGLYYSLEDGRCKRITLFAAPEYPL